MLEKIYNLGIPYLVCCRKTLLGEDWFLCVFTEDRPDKKFTVSHHHDCICESNLSENDIFFFRKHRSLFSFREPEEGMRFFEDRRYNFRELFKEKSKTYKKKTGVNYGMMYRPRMSKVA